MSTDLVRSGPVVDASHVPVFPVPPGMLGAFEVGSAAYCGGCMELVVESDGQPNDFGTAPCMNAVGVVAYAVWCTRPGCVAEPYRWSGAAPLRPLGTWPRELVGLLLAADWQLAERRWECPNHLG